MKWLSFINVFAGRSVLMDVGPTGVGHVLRAVAELVDQGRMRPLIDAKRFTFAQVSEAHTPAEHNRPTGKVVLSRS